MAKHRGAKGPEVVRHRRYIDPADRTALIVALLLLAAGFGGIGYLLLTIPTGHGVTTP